MNNPLGGFARACGHNLSTWLPATAVRMAAAITILLAGGFVRAQGGSGTGTIQGRVLNPATGEYVRNAEIRLQGTAWVTYSEEGGRYRLDNVPAGEAVVTVSYTGLQTASSSVQVSAGQIAVRDFELESLVGRRSADGETVDLEAYVVSAEREGNAKAIMAQRRNMNVTTSVASDIFGDVSEGNVGEFLKFLPGVDLEYVDAEGRGPRLGGLDPQYVGVSVDGARLASADAFASYNGFINGAAGDGVRSVGFEQLSINNIESIEINRTTSADMDADAPAGTINLKSRRAFDSKGRRITWQTSLSANSDDFRWGKVNRPGDKESRLIRPSFKFGFSDAFLDNRLGVILGVASSRVLVQQNSINHTFNRTASEADPRPIVVTQVSFGDGPKFLDRDSASLNIDFKATERLVLSLSTMYNTYDGKTFSRSLAFNLGSNNTNANTGRNRVLGDGVTDISTNGLAANTSRTVAISGGQNFNKQTRTVTMTPRFEYTTERLVIDGTGSYSRSRNDYDSFESGSVRVETVNPVTADFNLTRSSMNSPEWTVTQLGGPNWSDLGNYLNPRVSTDENRGARVEVYQGEVNAKYTLPIRVPTFVKVGGKVTEESRKSYSRNAANANNYVGPGGGPTGSFALYPSARLFSTSWGGIDALTFTNASVPIHPSRQGLADVLRDHPEYLVSTTTVENYYAAFYGNNRDFKQTVPALYTMMNSRVGRLQYQGGVRWERTETVSMEYDPLSLAEVQAAGFPVSLTTNRATTIPGIDHQFGTRPRVKRTGAYDNFFPSFSAKYDILQNLQVQVGYSHTIARAPINKLAGVFVVDDDDMRVSAPNTSLKPEIADNFVARLAWYFEPVGSFTFLIQQNDITDLITGATLTSQEFGIPPGELYDGFEFVTFSNSAERFRYRNMEIGYNQQLSFLPGPLEGLNASLSYSRSYANLRRPGLVPHKFTGGLGWNYWRVNLRLGAIWTDDTQFTTTNGRFRRQQVKYDLSGGLRITPRVSLFFYGKNITNEPLELWDGPTAGGAPAILQSYRNYGTSWEFGLKGTF